MARAGSIIRTVKQASADAVASHRHFSAASATLIVHHPDGETVMASNIAIAADITMPAAY